MSDAEGVAACPFCGGRWMSAVEIGRFADGAVERLTLETRDDCGAFARTRACPECGKPLAPWRMGKLDAWIEKCAGCERYWVERLDLRSLGLLAKQKRMRTAFESFTPEERQELVSDLAEASGGQSAPALNPVQLALAYVGVPSVTSLTTTTLTPGELAAGRFLRVPWATWTLAGLLAAVFVGGRVWPLALGADALAYRSGAPLGWAVFTAVFAHFGWWHLIGNAGFLLAFGDGVEQRVARWKLVLGFVLLGAGTVWVQAAMTPEAGVLVGGASGAVGALVGACLVLQSGARVTFVFLRKLPITVPMLAFGGIELLYQGVCALAGVEGVGWWAHLSGLVAGLAWGAWVRGRERAGEGK